MARIIIDRGHGGRDPGAVHAPGETKEIDISHPAGRLLGKYLTQLGHEVLFTPVGKEELSATAKFDRDDRVEWANLKKADLFVSIHVDASESHQAEGGTVFYYRQGKELATYLAEAISMIPERRRGAKQARFTVLTETDMPAVLMELGFVDNDDDRDFLLLNYPEMMRRASRIIDTHLWEVFRKRGGK